MRFFDGSPKTEPNPEKRGSAEDDSSAVIGSCGRDFGCPARVDFVRNTPCVMHRSVPNTVANRAFGSRFRMFGQVSMFCVSPFVVESDEAACVLFRSVELRVSPLT